MLEISPLDFREGFRVAAKFGIHGIYETRQGRTRPRIAQDSLPGEVSPHSGMSVGRSWTNLARSPDERPRMAVSIS